MSSTQDIPAQKHRRRGRRFRCGGAEAIEFTLVLLPLISITGVLIDTSWAIFAKSALQRAVRIGVRTGVTLTNSQMTNGATLTSTVKSIVQANSLGVLRDTSLIKVNYLQPPAPGSTAAAVDVSNQASGDAYPNIMVVSVQNYSLLPLFPRVFSWARGTIDVSPMVFTVKVSSADLIEPSLNPPPIGTAP